MKDWAEFLQAIAALLWPILAFITVLVFKHNLRDLIRRLKKGKLLGQELELDASLTDLEVKSTNIVSEVSPGSVGTTSMANVGHINEKVLELASRSPKAALMLLASEIEKQLRVFMSITGHHTRIKDTSLGTIPTYLVKSQGNE